MKIESPPALKGKTDAIVWANLSTWLRSMRDQVSSKARINLAPVPDLRTESDAPSWNALSKWNDVLHTQISGAFTHSFNSVTKTTTATLRPEEMGIVFVDSSSAAFTITLPPAAKCGAGGWFRFIKTDSSANAVTLDGSGSETINGAATEARINAQYDSLEIMTNNSAWYITTILSTM